MSQYWMIFELLFILVFLATVVILSTAALQAVRGQRRKSLRILRFSAASLAIYFAICCESTLLTPRRTLSLHEPQCFDDWCATLDGVLETHSGGINNYEATIRIFSQAKRVAQREKNVAFYLEDDAGHRYAPRPDVSPAPSDVLLQPGQSEIITRVYQVPAGIHVAGFVVTHEGGFPIQWFIIAEGQSLFHKEPITRIP